MRILKAILGVIVVIVVLLLIVALFVKKEFKVERSIVINKPKDTVFNYIKFIRNQDNYSVWNQMDPNMKKAYTGTDGTPGFIYAWDSQVKDAGKGEQEIASIKPNERIDMNLHFIKPYESRAQCYMSTDDARAGQTKVSWVITGKMPYPMNLMLLFMNMDKMMGGDLEKGLSNLKTILEK